MKFAKILLSAGLLISLFGCQQIQQSSDSQKDGTLTLTFNGKTKTYTDVSISEGKLGSIVSIGITAGSTGDDYLSSMVYAHQPGTYPYKQDIGNYTQVSQVEYKINGTVFNNYFMQIRSDKSGYSSSKGEINYRIHAGQTCKGTLSGALFDANNPEECHRTALHLAVRVI